MDNRGWDGWKASLTQWTWVRGNSARQWRTGKPGLLQSMGLQRVGHNLVTGQQQWLCWVFVAAHKRAFSSCGKWGILSSCSVQASPCGDVSCGAQNLGRVGFSGTQVLLPHGMWNLPRPGTEPVSPALAGGFSTTGPPGTSSLFYF